MTARLTVTFAALIAQHRLVNLPVLPVKRPARPDAPPRKETP